MLLAFSLVALALFTLPAVLIAAPLAALRLSVVRAHRYKP
jgi:hypothetical protein